MCNIVVAHECVTIQILARISFHMRLRPSQLWVSICVPLPQMNLQGHEMEMPRPLMVIPLKIHFTFLIYFKM